MKKLLLRLFAHMAWADERALRALTEAGDGHEAAREFYAHILGAEHVWLARLRGRDAPVPVWPEPELEACGRTAASVREAYADYLQPLKRADLKRSVTYVNSAGQEFDSRVEDILFHVLLHGAYHRGQVALLLRQEGAEPSPTDYIAFVRGAPAATRADGGDRSRQRG